MSWLENIRSALGFAPKKRVRHDDDFVVFDLETTGLNPEKDRVLSFAFIKVQQNEILLSEVFEGFINHESDQKLSSVEIHQITSEELKAGISEEAFIEKASQFMGDSVLVGHHVLFDVSCLNALRKKHQLEPLKNAMLDTAKLGARLSNPLISSSNPENKLKSLDVLCKEFGIAPESRHSASGDTYTTALLFVQLLKKAKQKQIEHL